MEITDIETIFVDRWLFVRVHTSQGIVGLGESGTWGYLEASEGAVRTFKRYLIGQDPLRIEHHWQYMYRNSHFRGAGIMGAIGAIDIALWDISGKYFGAPCYQLLGGKCRDKVRVYIHVFGETSEELVEGCLEAKKKGFTAVGHLSPFIPESVRMTHSKKIEDAARRVKAYREAVGDDVDLCIEIHRQLSPAEAVVLAKKISEYRPFFYEDPILPDSFHAMVEVASRIDVPIATGERLHTIWEFEELLMRGAVQYVRPDVCMAGGLTHTKKIAALAEAHNVKVAPHNPLSPVSTTACVQLDACIPNFGIQEYPYDEGIPPKSELFKYPLRVEKGYLIVPDSPGIGIELNDDKLGDYPYRPRKFVTHLGENGSVIDL